MKKIAAIIRALRALTQPYDVPVDHAFSRQSIEKQRDAALEALARAHLHIADKDAQIEKLVEQAKLFTAAPDLAKALQELLTRIGTPGSNAGEDELGIARDALEKAGVQ